jgi:hypothetical protein
MSDMTYAVHTATCTYLLDDGGVCRWTLSPIGVAGSGTDRCIGAQFVACLDLRAEGGLVGELRVGAAALFVRADEGRSVLLRTLPIDRVEIREQPEDLPSFEATPIFAPEHAAPEHAPWIEEPAPPLIADPPTAPPATLTQPFPAYEIPSEDTAQLDPRWSLPDEAPAEALDLEELLSISVTEVTLTLPLYRPLPPINPPARPPHAAPPRTPSQPAPAAPRRSVVGPGRRLR